MNILSQVSHLNNLFVPINFAFVFSIFVIVGIADFANLPVLDLTGIKCFFLLLVFVFLGGAIVNHVLNFGSLNALAANDSIKLFLLSFRDFSLDFFSACS